MGLRDAKTQPKVGGFKSKVNPESAEARAEHGDLPGGGGEGSDKQGFGGIKRRKK